MSRVGVGPLLKLPSLSPRAPLPYAWASFPFPAATAASLTGSPWDVILEMIHRLLFGHFPILAQCLPSCAVTVTVTDGQQRHMQGTHPATDTAEPHPEPWLLTALVLPTLGTVLFLPVGSFFLSRLLGWCQSPGPHAALLGEDSAVCT